MRNNEYITYDINKHRHTITAEYMRDDYGVELAGGIRQHRRYTPRHTADTVVKSSVYIIT